MGWHEFIIGLCLVLVFEGIMPFLRPDKYKEMIKKISTADNKQIRTYGLCSIIVGIIVLFLIKIFS
ncbi:MAG: hypothetical protein ACJA0H_001467 [Francisellaceae bacterium]|jgi:uncharacterized protein YjeT (DUF2065 family)